MPTRKMIIAPALIINKENAVGVPSLTERKCWNFQTFSGFVKAYQPNQKQTGIVNAMIITHVLLLKICRYNPRLGP